MYYHGTGANFTSQINQAGMQARFGDALHRILAAPLARGPDGYSSDISERDELDVMADVESHFSIDRTQVFSRGYSQGGYVAYYMAEEYPQLFAGVVAWVGFTGDELNGTPLKDTPGLSYTAGAVGNVLDFVPTLLNIPTFMLYSGQDELVHDQTSTGMDRAFAATANIYTWYFHPAGEHLTYIILDDWRKEAADTRGLRVVSDPVHVVFVRDPDTDSPAYGIRHDTAYWTSGITDRTPGVYGRVDLVNDGCGGTVPSTVTGNGAGTDPIPWVSDYRRQVRTTPVRHDLIQRRPHADAGRLGPAHRHALVAGGGHVPGVQGVQRPLPEPAHADEVAHPSRGPVHDVDLSSRPGRRSSSARTPRTSRSGRTASRA